MAKTPFPFDAFGQTIGDTIVTGDVYFVDSGHAQASDGNNGDDPERPLASLNGAYGRVTANQGDVVYLMPGHAENVSSATTQVLDVAGIRVVGLGSGDLRPTFTYTATAGSFECDAADTVIENVRFLSSISAVVVGINVDADDVHFVNCEWDFDASGDDFLIFADCEDVSGTVFKNCQFIAEIAAGSNEAIRLDNADNTKIIGNHFFGDFAIAAIYSDTSGDTGDGSTYCHNLEIRDNTIYQGDTGTGTAIDLNNAGDTGIIAYNTLGGPTGAGASVLLDPGACMCVENYAVNAVNESGALTPATVST